MRGRGLTGNHAFSGLLAIFRYDSRWRFDVLRREIQHLVNAIGYRLGSQLAPPEHSAEESQRAFLYQLDSSAGLLLKECLADKAEALQFQEGSAPAFGDSARKCGSRRVGDRHFEILWHAKMVHKASVLAERIGDLHDRLEQFLQRTSPDHPAPTLRRRSEQGLVDKYLSELSRWTHRDIARFAVTLGAKYPYPEVPSTYQFWAYDYTARHHSFVSSEGHQEWCRVIDPDKRTDQDFEPQHIPKFASVTLSYWMPERATLQPIIGHELAHQVLRDLYGREVDTTLLEHDPSQLGRTYRRLATCVEHWLASRNGAQGVDVKVASNLVQEVLCDLLAAVRFGYAYLYAWILEMLSEAKFAGLFHDRFGMLRRFGSADPTLRDDVLANTQALRAYVPKSYLRGFVLARFLRRMRRERDQMSKDLDQAFGGALDHILDIYSGAESPHREYWKAFANDLADTVCRETTLGDFAALFSGQSRLLQQAQRFWDTKETSRHTMKEASLDRQLMSHDLRKWLQLHFSDPVNESEPLSEGFQWPNVRMFTDAAWRLEWALQSSEPSPTRPSGLPNGVRNLYFLGMDDYLYRTGGPFWLFYLLLGREKFASPDWVSDGALPRLTNSIDPKVVAEEHDDGLVLKLDAVLSLRAKGESSQLLVIEHQHKRVRLPTGASD